MIVDAHEDIAYNMLTYGRDYVRSAHDTRAREAREPLIRAETGSCMLGLPEWLAGGVAVIFGTIFTMPVRTRASALESRVAYTTPEEAYTRAMRQADLYARLADENPQLALVRTVRELEQVVKTWQDASPDAENKRQVGGPPEVGIVLLMEGADPIVKPEDVERWYERGLRAVGLAWRAGTQYAGGDGAPGPLTVEGVRLLRHMNDLNMILDVSHLAEQACLQALERYDGPVIASHSNPRALVPGNRQLSDDMIRRILDHDGVIGALPVNSMLSRDWTRGARKELVTVDAVAAVIDYVCQMAGDARHAGVGSDFDGGFGAESAPAEIDTVADLGKIGEALKARGYAQADVDAVLAGNWLRVLRQTLP